MAKTTPSPVGAWPAPIPFGQARAALWLDGSTAGAAIAHWLTQAGVDWVALIDDGPPHPTRAREAARAIAGSLGVSAHPVTAEGPVTTPLGWAKAAHVGQEAGATWLVLPTLADENEPPLPLRLHAAETALVTHGMAGLWAPLLGWDTVAVGRLALALGVPFTHTWDCVADTACHQCAGCVARERMFKQLGLPDPQA
jgi:7-cyano-7-deazaguanine synthase in queuosine biosynthesis